MKVEEEEGKLKKEKKVQEEILVFSKIYFNKYSLGIRRWVLISPTVSLFEL